MDGSTRLDGVGAPAQILIVGDGDAVARASADLLVRWLTDAIAARDVAHVALTGGSSAAGLYRELRSPERRSAVDWEHVHLWWGDDRYVPLDHPDSNAGAAFEQLLGKDGVPVPGANVHPFPIETALADGRGPAWVAEAYSSELLTMVRLVRGVPALDVVLLGMGPDGHILSVFPDSAALADDAPLVMPIPVPAHIEPHVARITLSPRVLDPANRLLVMVRGANKAETARNVLTGERDPLRYPAQLAVRATATWVLDADSASLLPHSADSGSRLTGSTD